MGGQSSPNIPAVPEFQSNPNTKPNIDLQSFLGQALSQGDFLPGVDAQLPKNLQKEFGGRNLDFLEGLVTPNNELTQAQVGLASRDVIRMRDEAQQNVLNQLEANNQLTSSVAVDRLSDLNQEFSADISDIATNFYINDLNRATENTFDLFQLGLQTNQAATSSSLAEQQQRNSFALDNFGNQLAASQLQQQQSGSGGVIGGALGTALGAGIGTLIAPGVGTAAGAAIGGGLGAGAGELFSPSSTGAGATAFGAGAMGTLATLGSNPIGVSKNRQSNLNDTLLGISNP